MPTLVVSGFLRFACTVHTCAAQSASKVQVKSMVGLNLQRVTNRQQNSH